MDMSSALAAFGALSQQTRLEVFRLLIEAGPDGLAAGEIAERAGVRQNLMSTHLNILHQAGLTRVRREGRWIFHAIEMEAVRGLIAFLIEDCCKGRPSDCAKLIDAVAPSCCA